MTTTEPRSTPVLEDFAARTGRSAASEAPAPRDDLRDAAALVHRRTDVRRRRNPLRHDGRARRCVVDPRAVLRRSRVGPDRARRGDPVAAVTGNGARHHRDQRGDDRGVGAHPHRRDRDRQRRNPRSLGNRRHRVRDLRRARDRRERPAAEPSGSRGDRSARRSVARARPSSASWSWWSPHSCSAPRSRMAEAAAPPPTVTTTAPRKPSARGRPGMRTPMTLPSTTRASGCCTTVTTRRSRPSSR